MTIITSKEKYKNINRWIGAFVFVAIISAFYGVFLYNKIVGIKHDIGANKISLREVEVENAELKNSVYTATKGEKGKEVLIQRGFIVEKNPEYVKNKHIVIR